MITPLDILSVEKWLLIATAVILIRYYLHRKWQYWENLNIPYLKPSIRNFGNWSQLFHKHDSFFLDNKCKEKYGPIWGNFIGTSPSVTIHDPDMLRQIFIKEFPSFPYRVKKLRKINGRELNNGLTNVVGEQWKRTRTSMTPTFSTSKLKQMAGIIEWCVDNTTEVLNRKIKSAEGVFNPKEVFSRLSLDIVCSAAFSTNVHSQDDTKEEPEIAKQAKTLFQGSFRFSLIFLCLLSDTIEKIVEKLNMSVFPKQAINYFRDLSLVIMKQRKENPHSNKGRVDLMQLMLDTETTKEKLKKGETKGMTRDEIIGNSMLMILAGYENTGNTMIFFAHSLAFHPEIQEKLQKEIDDMLASGGKFNYEGINSLKYLEMCMNETLRLYMPILRNIRISCKEVTINGFHFPEGSSVTVPCFALAHDPEYWSEPFQFKPERMEDMSQIDPMVFQPFGAGPRNCIGMRFALMEVKMSIAKILHKFSFKPAKDTPKPPLDLKMELSVRADVDFNLQVIPRELQS